MDESCVMSAALVMYNLTLTFMYVSSTDNLSLFHLMMGSQGVEERINLRLVEPQF